jgi:hypothetical protein
MPKGKKKKQGSKHGKQGGTSLSDAKLKSGEFAIMHGREEGAALDWEAMRVKGTATKLEKRYLRLTTAPDPATVRPLPVLKQALEWVKGLWERKERDYLYVCDQLKSIRQDCVVQHIADEFTVTAYETHARIALEEGDANEFNQCQTQLVKLYGEGIPGHDMEFLGYRLLYCMFSGSRADTLAVLGSLSPLQRSEPAVRHATKVLHAFGTNNYVRFFRLYGSAPHAGSLVMELVATAMRKRALACMAKAFKPTLQLAVVQSTLAFESQEAAAEFLKSLGACIEDDGATWNIKAAAIDIS